MFSRVVKGLLMGLAVLGYLAVAARPLEAAEAEGAHGSAGINPLDWKADLAIWTAVIFLLLLAILWKVAWRRIADGLEKRERRIADEIASAEQSNVDARKLLDEYQQKLAASGEEVQQRLEKARHEADQVGRTIVEKAREAAELEHRKALAEIDLATSGALKELAELSATLAVELAGKIVNARLDPQAHTRLIEQAVADFSRPKPSEN